MCKIYVLRDPRNGDIRYVGKTIQKLTNRLRSHLNDYKKYKSYKVNWLKQLSELNLKPTIELIIEVPLEEWEYWEINFIKYYTEIGYDLTNLTDGGRAYEQIWELSNNATSIEIYQFDLEGKYIQTWKSCSHAAKYLKINASHISENATLKIKSYKNYIWSYSKFLDLNKYIWISKKKILELDKNNNIIKEWSSITEAANYYKVKPPNISRCLRGERKFFKKHKWTYK